MGLTTNITPRREMKEIMTLRIVNFSLSIHAEKAKEKIGIQKKIAVASAAGMKCREVKMPKTIIAPNIP